MKGGLFQHLEKQILKKPPIKNNWSVFMLIFIFKVLSAFIDNQTTNIYWALIIFAVSGTVSEREGVKGVDFTPKELATS